MNSPSELINKNSKKKLIVTWQCIFILLLIFLACSRWIPGGDPLNPETGIRGWLEVGIITLDFFIMIWLWGINKLSVGLKSFTFVLLILFCFWALLTSIWAPNHLVAIGKAGTLFLIVIISAAIGYQSIKNEIPIVTIVFSAMIILVAFLFLINKIFLHSFFPIDWSVTRPRFTLGYNHPNLSSTYFSTIIICCAYFTRTSKKISKKLFFLVIIGIFSVFLYLSDSRTSIASVFITILIYVIFQIKSIHIKTILYISMLTFLMLFSVLLITGSLDLWLTHLTGSAVNLSSLNGRVNLWSELFSKLNLGGNGYFSSRYLFTSSFSWGFSAHNTYLEVLSSTGIIGFLLLVSFYLSTYSLLTQAKEFPLAFIFLLYASLESLLEARLFVPSEIMAVTCLFIFYHQFKHQYFPTVSTSKPLIENEK
jgi:O-antigen ligase